MLTIKEYDALPSTEARKEYFNSLDKIGQDIFTGHVMLDVYEELKEEEPTITWKEFCKRVCTSKF